jgi:hypothetical protein
LLEYAKRFAELCTKNKTKLAFYMVWPSKARSLDLDNVIDSYTNAAQKTLSMLCPAGLAWKHALQADASLQLYSADNFHPSMTGSVLAALTVYSSLLEKDNLEFIDYRKSTWKNQVTSETLQLLKQAALKAIKK